MTFLPFLINDFWLQNGVWTEFSHMKVKGVSECYSWLKTPNFGTDFLLNDYGWFF